MEADKCEIAAERWERRRRGGGKAVFVGSHGNGGENVSEHVLQDRLSGSGWREERKGVKMLFGARVGGGLTLLLAARAQRPENPRDRGGENQSGKEASSGEGSQAPHV